MQPMGGAAGYCIGVTDKAFAPYTPNIKNPCPDQKWGWTLVGDPSNQQCSQFVGSGYMSAMGGCISGSQPGKTLFLLRNTFIQ
jgi:hypothetical protein